MEDKRTCLYCGIDISNKSKNAVFCCIEHRSKQRSKKISYDDNKKRVCLLCGEDISHKKSNARFCSRLHKNRYYKTINRDKVNEWKRESYKKNKEHILKHNVEKSHKEKEIYGFSKKYLREYATRHQQELINLKGKKCFKCGKKQYLGIHHVKYTKDPKDWEFVCEKCHRLIHEPTTLFSEDL